MRARRREASWELWSRGLRSVEVKSGFAFPELLGSARAGEGGLCPARLPRPLLLVARLGGWGWGGILIYRIDYNDSNQRGASSWFLPYTSSGRSPLEGLRCSPCSLGSYLEFCIIRGILINLVRFQFRGSRVSFSQGPAGEDFGLLLLVDRGFSWYSVASAFP